MEASTQRGQLRANLDAGFGTYGVVENLTYFRLGTASVLGGTQAQSAMRFFSEIANSDYRQMTAPFNLCCQ